VGDFADADHLFLPRDFNFSSGFFRTAFLLISGFLALLSSLSPAPGDAATFL
jgi:hypothetical protein